MTESQKKATGVVVIYDQSGGKQDAADDIKAVFNAYGAIV
jgi:hypothetical protein